MKEEMVTYTPNEIIKDLENGFASICKPFASHQATKSPIWKLTVETVKDIKLMNIMIFNNDYMGIPPSQTFISAKKEHFKGNQKLEAYDKKFVGAFWKYVFDGFGYTKSKKVMNSKCIIKTALYYFDNTEKVVVVENKEEREKKQPVGEKKTKENKAEETKKEQQKESKPKTVNQKSNKEEKAEK